MEIKSKQNYSPEYELQLEDALLVLLVTCKEFYKGISDEYDSISQLAENTPTERFLHSIARACKALTLDSAAHLDELFEDYKKIYSLEKLSELDTIRSNRLIDHFIEAMTLFLIRIKHAEDPKQSMLKIGEFNQEELDKISGQIDVVNKASLACREILDGIDRTQLITYIYQRNITDSDIKLYLVDYLNHFFPHSKSLSEQIMNLKIGIVGTKTQITEWMSIDRNVSEFMPNPENLEIEKRLLEWAIACERLNISIMASDLKDDRIYRGNTRDDLLANTFFSDHIDASGIGISEDHFVSILNIRDTNTVFTNQSLILICPTGFFGINKTQSFIVFENVELSSVKPTHSDLVSKSILEIQDQGLLKALLHSNFIPIKCHSSASFDIITKPDKFNFVDVDTESLFYLDVGMEIENILNRKTRIFAIRTTPHSSPVHATYFMLSEEDLDLTINSYLEKIRQQIQGLVEGFKSIEQLKLSLFYSNKSQESQKSLILDVNQTFRTYFEEVESLSYDEKGVAMNSWNNSMTYKDGWDFILTFHMSRDGNYGFMYDESQTTIISDVIKLRPSLSSYLTHLSTYSSQTPCAGVSSNSFSFSTLLLSSSVLLDFSDSSSKQLSLSAPFKFSRASCGALSDLLGTSEERDYDDEEKHFVPEKEAVKGNNGLWNVRLLQHTESQQQIGKVGFALFRTVEKGDKAGGGKEEEDEEDEEL